MTGKTRRPPETDGEGKPVEQVIRFTVKDRATAEQVAQALRSRRLVRPDVQIRPAGEYVEVRVHTRPKLVGDVKQTIATFELTGPIKQEPPEEDDEH